MVYHVPFTVLAKLIEWLGKGIAAIFGRSKNESVIENEVLDFLARNPEWHSASSIWAELYLGKVLEGVPFGAAFPRTGLKGWQRIKSDFTRARYEVRNMWRKRRYLRPEKKIETALLELWKKGLLQRGAWNADYYRVKR